MRTGLGLSCALVACFAATPITAQPTLNTKPARVMLLVDSSSAVGNMLTQFRAGLNAFIDGLPEDTEVGFITTGGQIRIRVQPTTDRDKLHKAASGFASDGGANAFLDTLLEADQRFLKKVADHRHVFVIVSTDDGSSRGEPRIDDYNKFMNEFRQRPGRAYGIVVRGSGMGPISEIINNLTSNTRGTYEVMNTANALAEKMKAIATRIANEP